MRFNEEDKYFGSFCELEEDVERMESQDAWSGDIPTNNIQVDGFSTVDIPGLSAATGLTPEELTDTDSGLICHLPDGRILPVHGCAMQSLFSRLCIGGAALGRLTSHALAGVLNTCVPVAKGKIFLLERFGKIAAFHSDGSNGYQVMPISAALEIAQKAIRQKGEPIFQGGTHSLTYTQATWVLPDFASETTAFLDAVLPEGVSRRWSVADMVPVARLSASDTASSAVALVPMLLSKNGVPIRFTDGVSVKHIRRPEGEMAGIPLFESKVREEFLPSYATLITRVKTMGNQAIYHPGNVVVGLCNAYKIPVKYGETAKQTVETLQEMEGGAPLTAYDVYSALMEAVGTAKESGAISETSYLTMEEKLLLGAKPDFDWAGLDLSGTVAWENVKARTEKKKEVA